MQQRTGFRPGGNAAAANADVPVLYYAFDLIYLDGEDWRKVSLEDRKRKLCRLSTRAIPCATPIITKSTAKPCSRWREKKAGRNSSRNGARVATKSAAAANG